MTGTASASAHAKESVICARERVTRVRKSATPGVCLMLCARQPTPAAVISKHSGLNTCLQKLLQHGLLMTDKS